MLTKNNFSNLNILWAELIIQELLRCGIEHFCIAPGSRSAPLAIAVEKNVRAKSLVHFDERGLGFYALGLTVATLKPTVIITTSGTAAANLFPGIIEASKKKLPLIVLTADRPPELRSTGANQTIDQVKIFGDYVRFFFDLPCPTDEIKPAMILTTIDQAVFRAQGELPGPVHINCMFREPLDPGQSFKNFSTYLESINDWQMTSLPYTRYAKSQLKISTQTANEVASILKNIKNGVIVVGKIGGEKDQEAVLTLARKLNWPVFADVTSGLRFGYKQPQIIHYFGHILTTTLVDKKLPIDGVLHLGGRLTWSRWSQIINKTQPRHYVMVLKHPLRNDADHVVSLRLQSEIKDFCETIAKKIAQRSSSRWLKTLQKSDEICEQIITNKFQKCSKMFCEPLVMNLVSKLFPVNSGVFIGNSMPIRDLNLFAAKNSPVIKITANRGASGIDGNIATAAGFARGFKRPCTALIGDLTFLHDLNSLCLLREFNQPFVLIVFNNNGGAIFSFLPIASLKSGFTKFFSTPHNMTFAYAAKLFGLTYVNVATAGDFEKTYLASIQKNQATLIEICCKASQNLQIHTEIQKEIQFGNR